MDETNLVKRVREERVTGYMKEGKPKNHGMRWWKRIRKSEACASMMPKTETSEDEAVEEWSAPINWKEDPAIKAERRKTLAYWKWETLCQKM